MKLFILSNKGNEIEYLRKTCIQFSLPAPIQWSYNHLTWTIKDLVRLSYEENSNSGENDTGFQIPESLKAVNAIIVFFRFSEIQIKEVIKKYKEDKKWPVFAVVTKTSLEMTLECLIDHLLFDRNEESTIKENGKKDTKLGE